MTEISKLKIFYFSGTGNAKQIALWTSECAIKKGVASEICNISNIKSLEVFDTKTTIVIISPIHGFSYPKITFDFIRRLSKGNNRVLLMATRAGLRIGNYVTPGLTGVAFFVSKLLLKSKGYRIIGQIPFDMPSNWFFLHPALSQKTVNFIFEKNHSRVKKSYRQTLFNKPEFSVTQRYTARCFDFPGSIRIFIGRKIRFGKIILRFSKMHELQLVYQ